VVVVVVHSALPAPIFDHVTTTPTAMSAVSGFDRLMLKSHVASPEQKSHQTRETVTPFNHFTASLHGSISVETEK
jgi:hypothetical protein